MYLIRGPLNRQAGRLASRHHLKGTALRTRSRAKVTVTKQLAQLAARPGVYVLAASYGSLFRSSECKPATGCPIVRPLVSIAAMHPAYGKWTGPASVETYVRETEESSKLLVRKAF